MLVRVSIVALGRPTIDLLVYLLELLCLLLGNVQLDRQIIVVFDQALDGTGSVL